MTSHEYRVKGILKTKTKLLPTELAYKNLILQCFKTNSLFYLISGKNKNRVFRRNCSSTVCYTVEVCYLRCLEEGCNECRKETVCDPIDC